MTKKNKILLVEDNEDIVLTLTELMEHDIDISNAENLEKATKKLTEENFDSIILDLNLPDSIGLNTLKSISDRFPLIPIIIFTGINDEYVGIESIKKGAQDFLIKGKINKDVLLCSLKYAIERKKNEIILIESKEKYKSLFEKARDAVFIADIETGIIIDANIQAERLLKKSRDQIIGTNFAAIHPPDQIDYATSVFKKDIKQKEQQNKEQQKNGFIYIDIITSDKKRVPVEINASIISLPDGRKIIQGIFRDITEKKKAEEEMIRGTKKLAISNKELEQFAYIASHDLQEPLRSIYSFTELLASRYKGKFDQEADDFIDYIIVGTKRMQEMIDDLLYLSRITTRGKEFIPTNVSDILNQVLRNLDSLIKENNAIITIDNMPTINTDPFQLTQLFQNLIDNSIKFRKKDIVPKIHISATKKQEEWIFSIQDNGIGIDQKNFIKLFKAFSRLHSKEDYPGTGIGLAICKKIVDRHEGEIWVESKLEEGSTFNFTIPIKRIDKK